MRRGISRRGFVRALGLAALAAPFVRPGRALAAESGFAQRIIVFFSPNGTIHRFWRPTGSGRRFELSAGSVLEPLADWRDSLIINDGIDFKGVSNHEGGFSSMLTGGGGENTSTGGMSVDQYIASRIGQETAFSSLELGVQTSAWGASQQTRMCYTGPGEFAPNDDDPNSVFRRLFAGAAGGETELDRLAARRASILDNTLDELRGLRARVDTVERDKLDLHIDAVRTLERRIQGSDPLSCDSPTPFPELDVHANDNFPQVARMQIDLLVAAMACGATRVGSLQLSHTISPTVFSWAGVGDGHHSLSHYDSSNEAGMAQYIACERWFASQFAYLLGELAARPEPGAEGTMLDHSVVVWASELGDGALHSCEDVPWVLAGGAGGYLDGGRYLSHGGAPHQQLLVSLCHAMGLDNQTFGDPQHGAGALPGLAA